jgi:hypothetical protein
MLGDFKRRFSLVYLCFEVKLYGRHGFGLECICVLHCASLFVWARWVFFAMVALSWLLVLGVVCLGWT